MANLTPCVARAFIQNLFSPQSLARSAFHLPFKENLATQHKLWNLCMLQDLCEPMTQPSRRRALRRTDSNLLASEGLHGEIKKEQACIHSFDSVRGSIRSLFLLEVLRAPASLRHALGLSFGFGERKVLQISQVRPF
jgi:hypothetical protein